MAACRVPLTIYSRLATSIPQYFPFSRLHFLLHIVFPFLVRVSFVLSASYLVSCSRQSVHAAFRDSSISVATKIVFVSPRAPGSVPRPASPTAPAYLSMNNLINTTNESEPEHGLRQSPVVTDEDKLSWVLLDEVPVEV